MDWVLVWTIFARSSFSPHALGFGFGRLALAYNEAMKSIKSTITPELLIFIAMLTGAWMQWEWAVNLALVGIWVLVSLNAVFVYCVANARVSRIKDFPIIPGGAAINTALVLLLAALGHTVTAVALAIPLVFYVCMIALSRQGSPQQ